MTITLRKANNVVRKGQGVLVWACENEARDHRIGTFFPTPEGALGRGNGAEGYRAYPFLKTGSSVVRWQQGHGYGEYATRIPVDAYTQIEG